MSKILNEGYRDLAYYEQFANPLSKKHVHFVYFAMLEVALIMRIVAILS